jgi:hypothetical protein
MQTTNLKPLSRNEIYVNEIEFTCKDEVSLFGFIQDCGKFIETQYIISRKDLQILLSQNRNAGIEILWQIETLFAAPHSAPASLNLIDLFGTTQVFDACEITLELPLFREEQDELPGQKHFVFFVEEVLPLNLKGEARTATPERISTTH